MVMVYQMSSCSVWGGVFEEWLHLTDLVHLDTANSSKTLRTVFLATLSRSNFGSNHVRNGCKAGFLFLEWLCARKVKVASIELSDYVCGSDGGELLRKF